MRRKIVLLGEAPSATSVFPFDGDSGDRLARLAGLHDRYDLRRFRCENLLDEYPGWSGRKKGSKFPADLARFKAMHKAHEWRRDRRKYPPSNVVLVGRRVAVAFGLGDWPFFTWCGYYRHPVRGIAKVDLCGYRGTPPEDSCNARIAIVPHPSGCNHWYGNPRNYRRAAGFMRCLTPKQTPDEWWAAPVVDLSKVHWEVT